MGRCNKCHRVLKDPTSVERGFGPVCWKKVAGGQAEHKKPFQEDQAGRSNFDFRLRHKGETPVVVINDLNQGGMSVTNNIEAVVASVFGDLGMKPQDAKIVYRDSEGVYDGVRAGENGLLDFYSLGGAVRDEDTAVQIAAGGADA